MSEIPQLTTEQLAAGREKRRAKLFERHCEGGRLTAAERTEIADLISAAEKSATANDLQLEPASSVALSRRTGLANGLQHYADLLGVGLRTVKRWHSEGVKARDACPLDDLTQIGAWWKRLHPQRAMDCNVALAIERALQAKITSAPPENAQVKSSGPATEGGEGESAASAPPPPAPEAKPSIALADVAAVTLESHLHTLKTIHGANVELLERAFKSGSQSEVDARHRNVERSAKMLLDAQTALDEHLKARGDLMPREEIKRELMRVHTAMAQSLVSQIVHLGIHRDRATSVVDSWFGHLRQSRFAATTAPTLRTPDASATAA